LAMFAVSVSVRGRSRVKLASRPAVRRSGARRRPFVASAHVLSSDQSDTRTRGTGGGARWSSRKSVNAGRVWRGCGPGADAAKGPCRGRGARERAARASRGLHWCHAATRDTNLASLPRRPTTQRNTARAASPRSSLARLGGTAAGVRRSPSGDRPSQPAGTRSQPAVT
jgi:hypothetical protein